MSDGLEMRVRRRFQKYWESWHGVDFSSITDIEELGLDPLLVEQGSTSLNKFTKQMFERIGIEEGDRIIDVGCAKGGALFCMTKFPFSEICGIDISEKLVEIAKKNFTVFRDARVKIEHCDATKYQMYSSYNLIYLYNPFPSKVFKKFIRNITKSIEEKTECILIYNNPVCHNDVIQNGFRKVFDFPGAYGNKISIYSNKSESRKLNHLK